MPRRKVKLWLLFIPVVGQLYLCSLILDILRGYDVGLTGDDEEPGST